jgi:hypothetical protein
MEEEDQVMAQIQQIQREQQRQDAIAIEQQRQNAIRQQQEEAKATQIQREQQHQDAIDIEQQHQKTIRQQQEEAKATQIQHEQQRKDDIEQQRQERASQNLQDAIEQKRQETQRASQNFQDAIEQKRQETQHASWLSVRSPKAKKMEDRLSPKAQDLVKKSGKVKSALNDLVVEERKERKRASESKSRKQKGFAEGLRVDTEAQQQRAPSADLHAMEMDTIDEIGADLIRDVQEVQYNFPSPASLEDGL